MMIVMQKKPLSWTLQKRRTLVLSSLFLSLLCAVLVTSEIILPKIELQRIHLEYDIPQKMDDDHHDRSVQEQSAQYQPIRIAFDTRVLDSLYGLGDTDVDAKIDFIKSTILPQTAQRWSQHLYVTPVMSWITPILIGPEACGGWYSSFLTSTIPYTDADLVIIVGGDPGSFCSGGTLAYAVPCSFDSTLDRPVTGTFNFCLAKLSSTSLQIGDGTSALQRLTGSNIPSFYSVYANTTFYPERLSISILDVTVHEVAHILGFSDLLYPYTRDEYGVPRTPRNTSNFNLPPQIQRTCGNGTVAYGYFPSENVVQVIQPYAEDPNRYEQYFVTERVRAISQIHFNCPTLMGARLEDVIDGDRPCFGAHWHERIYYGELLSPTVSEGSENVLSLLTLAYMEDTGWYKVDYRGAGYPSFGLGAGCDFVSEPCINSTSGEVLKVAENEFCNTPLYLNDIGIPTMESLNSILCDPSYQSWVLCDLSNIGSIDANERTYFSDETLSTIFFRRADNCPIPSLNLGIDCFDDSVAYNEFYAGESVGPNSRCLNAYSDSSEFGRAYRPACIRVTCDLTERVVRIGQNETEQICKYDGQLLVVPGGRTDGATIVCPRLASVCPALFTCPDGCFGRGECVYNNVDSNGSPIPTCRCFDGNNTHPSCAPSLFANRVTNAPSPPTTASPIIPGLPSVFNPAVVPYTTFSPVGTSPALTTSPIPPTISPVLPTQSLSPDEPTVTRAPSPTLRQTNTTATAPPTISSASLTSLSDHSLHAVTITLLMFYLTGLWI